MGMKTDLKLKGNDFSNGASAFFIAYLVAEVPNGKDPAFRGPRDILTTHDFSILSSKDSSGKMAWI
jgi:hypothetical protein